MGSDRCIISEGTGVQGTASHVQVKGGSLAQLSDAPRRLVLGILPDADLTQT